MCIRDSYMAGSRLDYYSNVIDKDGNLQNNKPIYRRKITTVASYSQCLKIQTHYLSEQLENR